jgi:Tfp pilus assembly protein PilZ
VNVQGGVLKMQTVSCFLSKTTDFFKLYESQSKFGGMYVASNEKLELGASVAIKVYFADVGFHAFLSGTVVKHRSGDRNFSNHGLGFHLAFSNKDIMTRDFCLNSLSALVESEFLESVEN